MFAFKEHENLKCVRSAPPYLSLITENAQNMKIYRYYFLESNQKNPMWWVAFINEDAGCACGPWTLPLSFMPWRVWEDPLREGAQVFFPSRILTDAKLVRSDLQHLGVDLFFSSFHHILNIKNNFILILYC